VLADRRLDALLTQVLLDELELALSVAAEAVQRDDDGQVVVVAAKSAPKPAYVTT
jgi:hypothetical protein